MTAVLAILAAVLLPPLGVFLKSGIGTQFWINVLLTLVGWIPGVIHALWITFGQPGRLAKA